MSYYLDVLGNTSRHVSLPQTIVLDFSFTLTMDLELTGTSFVVAGGALTGTAGSENMIFFNSLTTLEIRQAGTIRTFTLNQSATGRHTYRLEGSGGSIELFQDDVSCGTAPLNRLPSINYFFPYGSVDRSARVYRLFWVDPVDTSYDYDASLSGGTDTSFVDQIGTNDGVFVNFQANPWVATSVITPPTANAGVDQSNIDAGAPVTLDASATSAGDGTITSYAWTQTAGDTVTLSDSTAIQPTFTAPTTASDQTLTFELTVTDSNSETDTDTVNINVLAQAIIISGMKRQVTKLGKLFDRPNTMTFAEEFWQKVYPTNNFVNWDSDKYPLIMYSSTDHSTGAGGIWVRVYEKSLGPVTDGTAWLEWDAVANRAEFSHITQKTNPITSGNQRETPTLLEHDGTLILYTHDNTSSIEGSPQSSYYATGTNGIDFSNRTLADFAHSQRFRTGDGHSGYASVGLNTFSEHNYKFIGRALQGGGDEAANGGLQVIASDDGITWDKIGFSRRSNTDLIAFNRVGEEEHAYPILQIYDAKKRGCILQNNISL